ncbi:MAG: hypothetical protein Q8M16_24355 [Pirellulaceae bacterium]|nr:hypothetical protein [Pirellulaceae bacterium]
MNRTLLCGLGVLLTCVGLIALKTRWDAVDSAEHLKAAREALELRQYNEARRHGDSAVTWLVPQEHREEAWYLTGRAYLEDQQLARIDRLPKAMEFLAKVPQQSSWYPQTALAMANDKLFEAKSSREALQIIDEALRDWPHDAGLNAWKLIWMTVTNRTALAEPYFRAGANSHGPDAEKLLQVWLQSQFAPHDLETQFDRQLGVAGSQESTTDAIRLERWTTLKRMNLAEPTNYAAIGEWYLDHGFLLEALEQLHAGRSAAEMSPDPCFLSVSVRAFCEAGQVEVAGPLLTPLQHLAPDYLHPVAAARVALARNQPDVALRELVAARQSWPGRLDPWLSKTLEQLYRQKGDADSVTVADGLMAEREWLAAQQSKLQQVLVRKLEPTDRTWLIDFLGRLNREFEVATLNTVP